MALCPASKNDKKLIMEIPPSCQADQVTGLKVDISDRIVVCK